jgi:hypothetical protein
MVIHAPGYIWRCLSLKTIKVVLDPTFRLALYFIQDSPNNLIFTRRELLLVITKLFIVVIERSCSRHDRYRSITIGC